MTLLNRFITDSLTANPFDEIIHPASLWPGGTERDQWLEMS